MKHIICQVAFPINISCFFFIVVKILYHNDILCFWISHYIIRTFLIIINNASLVIDKYLIEYICPNFIFHLSFYEFGKYCTDSSPPLIIVQRTHSKAEENMASLFIQALITSSNLGEPKRVPPWESAGPPFRAVTPASCYLKKTEFRLAPAYKNSESSVKLNHSCHFCVSKTKFNLLGGKS